MHTTIGRAWFLSGLLVIPACGGKSAGSPSATVSDGGDGNDAGGGNDAGAALAPGDFQASFGPIDLAPQYETTECIVQPFGNTEDVVVQGLDSTLAPGSHHLIVYLTKQSVSSTPVTCAPFTGLVGGMDTPLAVITREHVTFQFPQGVGQDVPAGANVKVEAHYINTTSSDLQGQGTVTFHTVAKATAPAYQAAGFLFWGTLNISIPPNSSFSTGPLFDVGPAGTHYMLATTHQHRLGTRAQIWGGTSASDQSNALADDRDWSNPSWKLLSPTFDFDGTNGLAFQCDWTNTTTATVTFGESALDEMCFIGGYYYPSQGFHFCLDGKCRFR
jgi:hypothetical protein